MKMYRAKTPKTIEVFEVVKETEKQVVYEYERNGRKYEQREAKSSAYGNWFYNFRDAKSHLIEQLESRLNSLYTAVSKSEKDLSDVIELKDES